MITQQFIEDTLESEGFVYQLAFFHHAGIFDQFCLDVNSAFRKPKWFKDHVERLRRYGEGWGFKKSLRPSAFFMVFLHDKIRERYVSLSDYYDDFKKSMEVL